MSILYEFSHIAAKAKSTVRSQEVRAYRWGRGQQGTPDSCQGFNTLRPYENSFPVTMTVRTATTNVS